MQRGPFQKLLPGGGIGQNKTFRGLSRKGLPPRAKNRAKRQYQELIRQF